MEADTGKTMQVSQRRFTHLAVGPAKPGFAAQLPRPFLLALVYCYMINDRLEMNEGNVPSGLFPEPGPRGLAFHVQAVHQQSAVSCKCILGSHSCPDLSFFGCLPSCFIRCNGLSRSCLAGMPSTSKTTWTGAGLCTSTLHAIELSAIGTVWAFSYHVFGEFTVLNAIASYLGRIE